MTRARHLPAAPMLLLLLLLLACAGAARADTPIGLFQSFAGNVNFTGTQTTIRTKDNGGNKTACTVSPPARDVSVALAGVPAGATILSAQLYWAGSGARADYKVKLDGAEVQAGAARQYASPTIGAGFDYFSGAADVTAQVQAKRNGDYRFSELEVDIRKPFCDVEGVLGGFALLVVYSDPAQPFRVLNLYEGFRHLRNSSLSLSLANFRIPDPLGTATARLGHITWEGDATLQQNGEKLLFNDVEMTDALNPGGNQFNSKSNINGDAASYGIDFDAYTVGGTAIKAGQTAAATTYQSGNDLVLLSAEIVAMPSVPVADLELAMVRNGDLAVSQNASYTLTVSNRGPNAENGQVTLSDTLPAGLLPLSAGGTGWTCGIAGQVVTCTWQGALAAGASLAPVTLVAQVGAAGTYTNTASVAGQAFDNVGANNSASDSATTVGAAAGQAYAFTDGPCVHNLAFGQSGQCRLFAGPVTAASNVAIYVTALAGGVPFRLSSTGNVTRALRFALSCHNPVRRANANAALGGVTMPACSENGSAPGSAGAAWSSAVNLVFEKDKPSAQAGQQFGYDDVGRIQLYLRDQADVVAAGLPFVSRPARLAFSAIRRTAGGLANPGATSGAGPAFAMAGEAFTISVAALSANGKVAANFGNEGATFSLSQARPDDPGANAATVDAPLLNGGFGPVLGGTATGSAFWWDEVGIVVLKPIVTGMDYLGTGPVDATAASVGRFYPSHFQTATTAPFGCLARMGCAPHGLDGAAYSGQPFGVQVTAFNARNVEVKNFNGVFARDITLTAVGQPGVPLALPAVPPLPPNGTLGANLIPAASILPNGAAAANPVYRLRVPFVHTVPHARDWTAPSPVFMRATSADDAAGAITVSSLRAANSVERGVMVVNGRLRLANAYGSELLRLPVRMDAQYWSAAAAWENNTRDASTALNPGALVFGNCLKNLRLGSTGTACKAAPVLQAGSLAPVTLAAGGGSFWLRAPGAGNNGSADIRINGPDWLPGTVARVVFGIYKSPLIYIREVY